jgi:hypothetical protein
VALFLANEAQQIESSFIWNIVHKSF